MDFDEIENHQEESAIKRQESSIKKKDGQMNSYYSEQSEEEIKEEVAV